MAKKKSDNDSLPKDKTLPKPKNKPEKLKIQLKSRKKDSDKKKASQDKNAEKVKTKKMLLNVPVNDIKLNRMNEVALAQLVKECPVAITESAPPLVPKKRGRKKKILEPETAVVVPKKKPKLPAKAKTKNTTKKIAKAKTPKVAATKRKAPKTPPVISPLPKRPRGRSRNVAKRGKPTADEVSTITSPSILSYTQPETKTPVTDTQKTVAESSIDPNTTKNNNDSRRTSVTSAPASDFSWTKDISGSSTTTCITVTSNDFVRIDGKVPELKIPKLKLDHVENKIEERETVMNEDKDLEHSLSEDSSSSSSSSSSSPSRSDTTAVENCLNLSTSSISPPPYSPTYTPHDQNADKNKRDEVTSILEMLAPKLKALDLEFSDIEDESEDFDMDPFVDKVSKYLEEEYNTMLECSFFNRILSEDCPPQTNAPEIEQKHSETLDFAMPDLSAISNKSALDGVSDTPSNISRRRDTYDPAEDDDVLSIYADNVFDSTRMSSVASNLEEYVPQPLAKRLQPAVSYQPSKKDEAETTSAKKPVCEKQNADSTSIHKEPELDEVSNETFNETFNETAVNYTIEGQKLTDKSVTDNRRPPLTIYYYPSFPGAKSLTLWGVCFFYLTSSCTKQDRAHTSFFPHRFIEDDEFKRRLAQLGEAQFFQEYNHIARRPTLRNKYVKFFIDECQRRELPKILVEIVIDFLLKTPRINVENEDLRVQVVEHALVQLNDWNLVVCEQLLGYKIRDEVLCDVFMKVIAKSQNFSRFKTVFLNLTDYIARANRTFDFTVAVHILERVCILPFEEQLATSLISIMERTDREIFKTNMSNMFDMLLSTFNKELHNKFLAIKKDVPIQSEGLKAAANPVLPRSPPVPSPSGSRELAPLVINPNSTREFEQRYTSPDTTNTDNVNKPVTEPTIVRTLNHLTRPPMNPCKRPPQGPGPRGMFRKWHNRSIMSQVPRMPYMRPPRPMKRPMARPPLEHPQFKSQRRYGPDF